MFEIEKPLDINIKNAGTLDVGPEGQPAPIAFAWSSKTLPGSDVYLKLADGNLVSLEETAHISNMIVPAKSSANLPLSLWIRNRKEASAGAGTLRVSISLPDSSSGSDSIVQTLDLSVSTKWDFIAMPWKQTLDLAGRCVSCEFAGLKNSKQEITFFQLLKAEGAQKLQVRLGVPSSALI